MREIKFREWDSDNQEMRSWEDIKDDRLSQSPSLELLQYTGQKDSKGTEIYEGDIVKTEHNTGEVKWHHNGYYVISPTMANAVEAKSGEVIGNIYENQGLL